MSLDEMETLDDRSTKQIFQSLFKEYTQKVSLRMEAKSVGKLRFTLGWIILLIK